MSHLQNKPNLYVDIEVDSLAEFIFLKNVNNSIIELELGGVENNKDMFYFLVDLLSKGTVLLFGTDNKVELDSLSLDNFKIIKDKMKLAGIKVLLDIIPNDSNLNPNVNIKDIELMDNNTNLEKFVLKVTGKKLINNISFKLIHNGYILDE